MEQFSATIFAVAIISLIAWIVLLIRKKGNLPAIVETVFPKSDQPQSTWRFADALIAFGMMYIVANIGVVVLRQMGKVAIPIEGVDLTEPQKLQNFIALISATVTAQIVASLIMIAVARSRPGTTMANLGLNFRPSDLVDGLKATVLILPPVLMISGVVNQLIPYEHPVLESLQSIESTGELTLVFLTTALVTPFFEEFVFRVLMISGLERFAMQVKSEDSDVSLDPEAEVDLTSDSLGNRLPFWPVLASSFLFAILHAGQGGAPIALFFLAIGLGVVFRQTRRIWPVMIVHMALNAMTLVSVTLQASS